MEDEFQDFCLNLSHKCYSTSAQDMPDFKVIYSTCVYFRLPKKPIFTFEGHINFTLAKPAL